MSATTSVDMASVAILSNRFERMSCQIPVHYCFYFFPSEICCINITVDFFFKYIAHYSLELSLAMLTSWPIIVAYVCTLLPFFIRLIWNHTTSSYFCTLAKTNFERYKFDNETDFVKTNCFKREKDIWKESRARTRKVKEKNTLQEKEHEKKTQCFV